MPLSRPALKHTAVPQFSGEMPEFTAWTRDARYYAKGVGFLSAFVPDPPQYIPVGELNTENTVFVERGYNRKSVHIHALARNFLSTALKSKSDKSIWNRCTSPREAWDALLVWYGPQTTGAKSDLSRRHDSFEIASGSNPLEKMGRVEDLPAEMRSAGMTLDDHMLYTIFIDALPAEYEVEARNLSSRDSIGRNDIIKAVREQHHRLSENRKKVSNAGHASHAMFADGGGGGRRKGAGGGAHRKGGEPMPRPGHAADVCPTSKEEAVLAASDDNPDDNTVEGSAFKAEETGECSDVFGKKGKGSQLGR